VGAKLKLKSQRATLEASRAQKPVLEAQLQQRNAELDSARQNAKLRIEEEKALAAAKASLALASAMRDEAGLKLSRTEVKSPADGVVMQRHVEPGAKLMLAMDDRNSMAIVHLYDPAKLQVRVDVPLADAAKVGVGMHAKIVVGVLPDKSFDGVVSRIVQEADVAKNTLQVKVAIKDPAAELKPEMLARVKFVGGMTKSAASGMATSDAGESGNVIYAPEALIQKHGDHSMVWVVERGSNVARQRMIQVGARREEGWVSVASGLNAGDQLIADVSNVSDGRRVRVIGEAK
jgi:RND family efflux transporter MFP subunit